MVLPNCSIMKTYFITAHFAKLFVTYSLKLALLFCAYLHSGEERPTAAMSQGEAFIAKWPRVGRSLIQVDWGSGMLVWG